MLFVRHRVLTLSALLAASLVVLAMALVWPPQAAPGTTTPPISWTPNHLVVTLTPGDSESIQATASFLRPVPAMTAGVVPALTPYISVSPAAITPMSAGSSQVFDLSFTIPEGTPFQTIEGTLHLRSEADTVARPLPITLNIWPEFSDATTGVSIGFPPDLLPEEMAVPPAPLGPGQAYTIAVFGPAQATGASPDEAPQTGCHLSLGLEDNSMQMALDQWLLLHNPPSTSEIDVLSTLANRPAIRRHGVDALFAAPYEMAFVPDTGVVYVLSAVAYGDPIDQQSCLTEFHDSLATFAIP